MTRPIGGGSLDEYDFDDEDEDSILEVEILEDEDSDVFEPALLDDIDLEEGMDSGAIHTDAVGGIDVDQLRQALAQAKSDRAAAATQRRAPARARVPAARHRDQRRHPDAAGSDRAARACRRRDDRPRCVGQPLDVCDGGSRGVR